MGLIRKPEVQTQYDNSCKQASIAHPNVVSTNRSTGLCGNSTGRHWSFFGASPKMVSGYRLQTNMRPVDAISRPVDTDNFFPPETKTGTCYRFMHCLKRLKLPKFYGKKIQQADHIRRDYSRLDQERRIHTFYEEPILNITFLTHDSSMLLMEIVITFLLPSLNQGFPTQYLKDKNIHGTQMGT